MVFRSKTLSVCSSLANALDRMTDEEDVPKVATPSTTIPELNAIWIVSARAHAFHVDIPQVEMGSTISLVIGDRAMEIPVHFYLRIFLLDPHKLLSPTYVILHVLLQPRANMNVQS